MGAHTGDPIMVALALTLTDKEYQIMRDARWRCCEIGVRPAAPTQFANSG
jgi:carbamoylphosphate synthase large subunit